MPPNDLFMGHGAPLTLLFTTTIHNHNALTLNFLKKPIRKQRLRRSRLFRYGGPFENSTRRFHWRRIRYVAFATPAARSSSDKRASTNGELGLLTRAAAEEVQFRASLRKTPWPDWSLGLAATVEANRFAFTGAHAAARFAELVQQNGCGTILRIKLGGNWGYPWGQGREI